MTISIQRFTSGVPGNLQQPAMLLVLGNAKELSAFHLEENDPFLPLAEGEVKTRLIDDFQMMENPHAEQGHTSKVEVILAIEEMDSQRKLVGLSTYKPRSPDFTCASIGYMVVAKNYRGRGILRMMMTELLSHYPIAGLDCPPRLVSLYEKFGFKPTGTQGTHIAMSTGELSGIMMSIDGNDIMRYPPLVQAKEKIRNSLGKNTSAGYSKFNEQNRLAVEEAEAFIASRGLQP